MPLKLEIACFSLPSAIIAEQAGANRVELCDDISVGGVTPDHTIIKEAKEKLGIDLFIMVRPRGGDFVYSQTEYKSMKADIEFCKKMKVNGVVFGILNTDNTVDLERNKELVELAKPLSCSFHRAFDQVKNSPEALEQVIGCGFSRILTSGSLTSAENGTNNLSALVKQAKGRIIVMPGGGIRSENILKIKNETNATEFHSSAITDKTGLADPGEVKLLIQKLG